MPAVRHKRSQNAGVVYTLVDEGATGGPAAMGLVDELMRDLLSKLKVNSEAQVQLELF
jgi:hypothetical protein